MIIQLDFSGHYDPRYVEVTEEELARIRELEKRGYLFDTEEGQDLIVDLQNRPRQKGPPIVLVYA